MLRIFAIGVMGSCLFLACKGPGVEKLAAVQIAPNLVLRLEDPGERITMMKKTGDGRIFVRGESHEKLAWYAFDQTSSRLLNARDILPHTDLPIIDFVFADRQTYLLCRKKKGLFGLLIADDRDDLERGTEGLEHIGFSIDFVPDRLFVIPEENRVVLGTALEFRKGPRYHFYEFSLQGKFLSRFGATIVLADSVPPYSLYYYAALNHHPRYGYVVSYWNLPRVFVYAHRGNATKEYILRNANELPAFYSYDAAKGVGMRIPQQRLLGNSAFDEEGMLWVPIIQLEGEDFYTEIRAYRDEQIVRSYRVPGAKILGIELSDDARFLYAHTLREFLYFELGND